jgi:hypothetical protein
MICRRAGTPNPKIKPLIEESRKQAKVPPADKLGLSPKVSVDVTCTDKHDDAHAAVAEPLSCAWPHKPCEDMVRHTASVLVVQEVADFIMFPVINEACRVVEEVHSLLRSLLLASPHMHVSQLS